MSAGQSPTVLAEMARGLLGGAGAGLQPEVSLHRLVDHAAGAAGRPGREDERIGRACDYVLDMR